MTMNAMKIVQQKLSLRIIHSFVRTAIFLANPVLALDLKSVLIIVKILEVSLILRSLRMEKDSETARAKMGFTK